MLECACTDNKVKKKPNTLTSSMMLDLAINAGSVCKGKHIHSFHMTQMKKLAAKTTTKSAYTIYFSFSWPGTPPDVSALVSRLLHPGLEKGLLVCPLSMQPNQLTASSSLPNRSKSSSSSSSPPASPLVVHVPGPY